MYGLGEVSPESESCGVGLIKALQLVEEECLGVLWDETWSRFELWCLFLNERCWMVYAS